MCPNVRSTLCSLLSLLKKTCVPIRERMAFSGEGWPHWSLEPVGELSPVPIVGAEALDGLHTGEKLFIFRNPADPEISLHIPPRKKKNFLNAKKASRTPGVDQGRPLCAARPAPSVPRVCSHAEDAGPLHAWPQ